MRDRVFGVVLAAALLHGGYLVYPHSTMSSGFCSPPFCCKSLSIILKSMFQILDKLLQLGSLRPGEQVGYIHGGHSPKEVLIDPRQVHF